MNDCSRLTAIPTEPMNAHLRIRVADQSSCLFVTTCKETKIIDSFTQYYRVGQGSKLPVLP